MTTEWHARWDENRIGFHRPEPNPNLTNHALSMRGWPGRVFLPLCGKTVDMPWLASRGCEVVGSELVSGAVSAFFEENAIEETVTPQGSITTRAGNGITIHQGDVFDLTPEIVGPIDWTFDRGALIALPPEIRARYAPHIARLTGADKEILLVHVEYDQSLMSGPPYSVPVEELRRLFEGHDLTLLHEAPALSPDSPFRQAGLTWLTERVWRIRLAD